MEVFGTMRDILSTVGDIMSAMGGYHKYRWGCHEYHGGCHEYREGCIEVWGDIVKNVMVLNIPHTCIIISPHSTEHKTWG